MSNDEVKPLTPKQLRFVEEYLIDSNGAQAAIRAGYSSKAAKEQASRMLTNANVSRALAERQKTISEKLGLDTEWILTKLKAVVDRALAHEPVMEFNHQTKQMEQTGEFQFDSAGVNRALELIGKHTGFFKTSEDDKPTVAIAFSINVGDAGREG